MSESEDSRLWPENIENHLIDLLYEESKKGLHTSTLDPKTWTRIEKDLATKFRKNYTVQQLKAKWNRLGRATRDFQTLIETIGFGWDSEANTVVADEDVWNSYLEKHPTASKYKNKGLANFNILNEIFGGTFATGQIAMGPNDAANFGQQARRDKQPVEKVEVEEEYMGDSDELCCPEKNKTRTRSMETVSSRSKKKSKTMIESFMETLEKNNNIRREASVRRNELLEQYLVGKAARAQERSGENDDASSVDSCVKLLDAMEDLDDQTYTKASTKLVGDKDLRRWFVLMKAERRRGWVLALKE